MKQPGRLGVGVIGAGRVGPVLAQALAGAGHAITGITAVSEDSVERVETLLPGVPILATDDVVRRSELVLIAVPDSELPGLVSGLATAKVWVAGQLVVHTSARFGIDVLQPATTAGVIPLAIHPAMGFSGTSLDRSRLLEAYCAVTSPPTVLPIAQALVVEMGAEPVVVDETDRESYAEAIVTATEFSRSIVEQSTGILSGIGIENPGMFLSGLVRSTVDNALRAIPPR